MGAALLVAGVVACAAAGVARAHHSFSANYDYRQPVRVTGVVTALEWTNPHIRFVVEVTGRNARVTAWEFSGDAGAALARRGVPSTTIQVGDMVRVDGFRAHDGSNRAAAGAVTFTTGRRVLVGPLEDPTPL